MFQLTNIIISFLEGLDVFLKGRRFPITNRGSLGYSAELGLVVNVSLEGINKRSVFHLRSFLFLKEQVEIFFEGRLSLLELFAEVKPCVLRFEGVSIALAKLLTLVRKGDEGAESINSVLAYKIIGFLPNSETTLTIRNFLSI